MKALSTFRAMALALKDRLRFRRRAPGFRVVFIANADIPTLQIYFTRPLRPFVESGKIACDLVTERDLKQRTPRLKTEDARRNWMVRKVLSSKPHLIVFCRYSGPYAADILAEARKRGISTIYHLDDDLLAVPIELGEKKHAFHNSPERLGSVRTLLNGADLVYCSTAPLRQILLAHGTTAPIMSGSLYCPSDFRQDPPPPSDTVTIGYMGFDHAHDFELALPALIDVLDSRPNTRFELFGSIPKPAVLDRFGNRVSTAEPVQGYDRFMKAFAARHWDIGICPLADTAFNAAKGNNKWVEYSSVGAAVIATGGTIYDDCCSGDCGILATDTASWRSAMTELVDNPSRRRTLAAKAQQRLAENYTMDQMRTQILGVFGKALHDKKTLTEGLERE